MNQPAPFESQPSDLRPAEVVRLVTRRGVRYQDRYYASPDLAQWLCTRVRVLGVAGGGSLLIEANGLRMHLSPKG